VQLIHTVYLRPINVQTISFAVIQMAPLSMKVLQLHQKLVIQKDVQAVNSVSLVNANAVVVYQLYLYGLKTLLLGLQRIGYL